MTVVTKTKHTGYDVFHLSNTHASVSLCSYGASVMSFALQGKESVVLTYHDATLYKDNPLYLSCIVGRHAGRIGNAEISIDAHTYPLSKNVNGKHQLHSGFHGAHTKHYEGTIVHDGVEFNTTLREGEDGFPGEVELKVRYVLKENSLHMEILSTSSQKTILSFTNHAYFNLNDDQSSITNHRLWLDAATMMSLDEELIPTSIIDITHTVFDFRQSKPIGQDIHAVHPQLALGKGYDHPYLLGNEGEMKKIAMLENEDMRLIIDSDQPAIIFYTGNFLDGTYFPYRCGVCLETSLPPNLMHVDTGISPFRTSNVQKTTYTLENK